MNQPNPALAAAFEAFQTGHLRRAHALGLEVLSHEPNNIQVLHLLSMAAHGMGDVPQHVEYLRRLLAVAPNHAPSLNALANILRTQGKTAEALEAARRAIQAAPQYANAHNTLGLCYEQLNDYQAAADSFRNAIRLEPKVAAIYVNLGAALQHLGEMTEALKTYQRALDLSPNSADAFEGMGHSLSSQRKRPEALKCFERALELTPDSVDRILLVANAKAMYGQTTESLALVERAVAIDPQSASAHFYMGLRMQDLGKFQEAKTAFLQSTALEPNQGEAYLGLASNGRAAGGDSVLAGQIQRLIEGELVSDKDSVLLHTALGKIFDDLGDYERAIWHIDEANRLESKRGHKAFDPGNFKKFVDGIIRCFSREFFEARKDWGLESKLPLLIIGLPRSGTTLTEQILTSHPEISGAGEQQFWSDIDESESILSLGSQKERSREIAAKYLGLLRGFDAEARFITDKRPDNFLFVGLIHAVFPMARFIHCRRQLADSALSIYMTPYRTRPPFAHSREDVVFYVEQYQRLMLHWHRVLPTNRMLDVDYEATVADRARAAKSMLDFCGLDWNEACSQPELNRRIVATPSNWQSRQAVYTTSVERWRNYEPWLGAIRKLLLIT